MGKRVKKKKESEEEIGMLSDIEWYFPLLLRDQRKTKKIKELLTVG